jgi:hypothetical protein
MVLSDQQLRQELINYGEIVPPITQRNREQLRARLEVLRAQKTKHAAGSPSRTRAAASPSRAASSPSRSRTTASPSRAASSPSRSRTTASPSHTRASGTANTGGSGRTTRSKQTPTLIELSDSDTESSSKGVLMSRSVRAGQTTPHAQTRSIALRSQHDSPTSTSKSIGSPGKMTNEVEESIARHRREIKQLLDSARDRKTHTNDSSSSSKQRNESSRSSSPSRIRRESSKSDDEGGKKSSRSPKRAGKAIQSCWKKYLNLIKNLVKILLLGSVLLGGIFFLAKYGGDILPRERAISCSVKNATECEDMKPVIAAVRKQLQVRTGEVDCGFRVKTDVRVPRAEIEKYLNEKGLKFNLGNEERWQALLTYIINKPINDIIIWDANDKQINTTIGASKLSTKDAIRSLTCRARQDINRTLRNLILLVLGSTGLLTLAWYLQRQSKTHEANEKTFKNYLQKATKLIEDEYEKHVHDPRAQPWLAINYIRDKLIPEQDQERLKNIWERVKNEISKKDSRIRSELQEIDGQKLDVWKWIKSTVSPKKTRSQTAKNTKEDTDDYPSAEVGLTECLKLRNCFRSDNYADDDEIDDVVDSIQNRCPNIEHIGIHSVFVYLKFPSKQAAGQGYHLLNNWNYQDRDINVKYVRLNRYYEHFPEAQDISTDN